MDKRLNIAFLWHMHQPLYKDPFSGEYLLPWVMLHGTKDYYDMASILDEFPQICQTFNIVPSLIEQLRDYECDDVPDVTRRVAARPAEELTEEDRRFILDRFFQANWQSMIKAYPRYWELLKKRGFSAFDHEIKSAARYFVDQDFLDLQVLFNLAWIDPQLIREDRELLSLREKGRDFTEDDKRLLLSRQTSIISRIIPKYRELSERGSVELTTSPYYHPIMPLLCDSDSAKEARPDILLPKERFIHPEDAVSQLKKAVELHREAFGKMPSGLWPSEGSVSMDVLPIVKDFGIEWIATDEEILAHSIGRNLARDEYGNLTDNFIYRPYSLDIGGSDLKLVFRDHMLSDLIGFDYARWDAEKAAHDLIERLNSIADRVDDPSKHIVNIILDGENAWETYPNDGRDFLCALYARLSDNQKLKTVTIGDFLSNGGGSERLNRVFAGSWINHDFRIWIGHIEDNSAWDHIKDARDALVSSEEAANKAPEENETLIKNIREAWDILYAAEGSDWFWWYGDDHSSANDDIFDSLFRLHIKKIYSLLGLDYPISLDVPIISRERGLRPERKPAKFIEPTIDGEITNYFEWLDAGTIDHALGGGIGGAMHADKRFDGVIEKISYGFDIDNLFLRFDYIEELRPFEEEYTISVNFLHPRSLKLSLTVKGNESSIKLYEHTEEGGEWSELGCNGEIASGDVVELSIPFKTIGAGPTDELWLFFMVDGGERGTERWPVKGFVIIDVPTENFGDEEWSA